MKRELSYHPSHNTRPQDRSANGVAATKPRATLRLEGAKRTNARDFCGARHSLPRITLSIMGTSLLLLSRSSQKFQRLFSSIKRKNDAHDAHSNARLENNRRPTALFRDECSAVTANIRLVPSGDPDREEKIDKVTHIGAGRSRKTHLRLVRYTALLMTCVAAPKVAVAQELTVDTPMDLFDTRTSQGVRISPSLVMKAGADATVEYDTNVYNDEVIERDDTVGILMPFVEFKTDLPRHGAALRASSEIRRYFNISEEDSEQFDVVGKAWLDLGSRMTYAGEAGIAQRIERRGTAGDLFNTDRPIQYTEKRLAGEIARTGGTLELILGASLTKRNFDDTTSGGVPIDLTYRDATVSQISGRANYKLSPKIGIYGDVSWNQVDYRRQLVTPRDSSGYALLGGIRYQVTTLIDLEGAVGYIRQNFDDPMTSDATGLNYQLKANWTPTPLWKFSASGQRTVDPSPLSNVPAVIRSDVRLNVQRALSEKFFLQSTVSYVDEDFRGSARDDKRYSVNGGILFRFSEHILASVQAGYRKQDSTLTGLNYEGASAGFTLSLTL